MDLKTRLATAPLGSAAGQQVSPGTVNLGTVNLGTAATSRAKSSSAALWNGIGQWIYALLDQAAVSGSRFLATIIVGRICGPGELGNYSLAMSLLVLAACFQEALITTPYAVLSQRLRSRPKARYSGALGWMHFQVVAGSAALLLALALVGFVLHVQSLGIVALVLALTLPSSLMADFARRFALANLKVQQAMRLDMTIAGLQLTLLLLLANASWLSTPAALLAIGTACSLPSLLWWTVADRSQMRSARSIAPYWGRSWSFGRWLLASQVTAALHGLIPVWLLTILVDARATGEFAACLNLALLVNPIIFAAGNLLTPRAAEALARGGTRSVRRVVIPVLLCLVGLMAVFALVLAFGGHLLIESIYGKSFVGSQTVAGLLGLTAIMWTISATCATGTAALGQPRWGFVASGAGTVVSSICIALLAPHWAVTGAAFGLLLGSATAASIHLWAFIRFSGGLSAARSARLESVNDYARTSQELVNA